MKAYHFFSLFFLCLSIFLQTACTGLQPISSQNDSGSSSNSHHNNDSGGTSDTRSELVDFAKEHLGTNYQYAGRSPKGFDCSGFTHYVFGEFDVDLTPVSRAQENEGKVISVDDAKTGDLIFFRRSKNGDVFHVSLVVSNGSDGLVVIHSTSSRGVVIDNIDQNSYWNSKYATARDVLSK